MESICTTFDRRLHTLTAAISSTLDSVTHDINERNLMRLLPLKNSLTSFELHVREVMGALQVRREH